MVGSKNQNGFCMGISNLDALHPPSMTPVWVSVSESLCKKNEGWEGTLTLTRINCLCFSFPTGPSPVV